MFQEKWKGKRLGQDIGRDIRGRYPICAESASADMVANEMMPDINMF